MRREQLKQWFMSEFLNQREGRGLPGVTFSSGIIEELAERFSRELPGVLVEDDYIVHMDEMLGMHATYLEAQHQVATTKLREDKRTDGKEKIEHIVETTHIEELRDRVADLRIAIEERAASRCPECGATSKCKMGCSTKKFS